MARTPDLTDVTLRLERAKEHIETVRRRSRAFLERDPKPFDFRTEETRLEEGAVQYVLYAVIRQHPPRSLGASVGDAIQNIRNALDYLVYELSPALYREQGKTAFPIHETKRGFDRVGRLRIRGITGDELALIKRFQPYNQAKPINYPLSVLKRLSNNDKHRLLLPVAAAVSNSNSWVASDNADVQFTYYAPGPVQHDGKILIFTARPQDPSRPMRIEPQSGLEIQLGEAGLFYPEGDPVTAELSDFLEYLWFHVSHEIIDMWFKYGYVVPRT